MQTLNCKFCQKEFKKKNSEIKKSKTGNHFCSQSCASSFNNNIFPKRKPEGKCNLCGIIIKKSRKYCKVCFENNKQKLCTPKILRRPNVKPKPLPLCKNCQKQCKTRRSKFCSKNCLIDFRKESLKIKIENTGCFCGPHIYHCPPFVKKYLRYKHGDKCSICNLSSLWNNKPLVLICDHINGIPNDWRIDNVRLVCPNCDSQLPTFKSKNKGNGRPR